MWKRRHAKYPIFLSDFNENRIFSTDFRKNWNMKFYQNPSSRSRVVSCGRTDGQTITTKLIVTFRNFEKACKYICVCVSCGKEFIIDYLLIYKELKHLLQNVFLWNYHVNHSSSVLSIYFDLKPSMSSDTNVLKQCCSYIQVPELCTFQREPKFCSEVYMPVSFQQ